MGELKSTVEAGANEAGRVCAASWPIPVLNGVGAGEKKLPGNVSGFTGVSICLEQQV